MIPILTPAQMAAADAAACEPAETLIARAGFAVAQAGIELLGGSYGRSVVVLAGPGNNGADGRVAARQLQRRGARVEVVSTARARAADELLPGADLYIDAAFGTGLSRPYSPPARAAPESPVLAVDIPSGLDGLTGLALGPEPWRANRTVTFAALKPGLLLGAGPSLCGTVTVAGIGLDVAAWSGCGLMTDADVEPLPAGCGTTHKWQAALLVVAGSPGMEGAASLTCSAALRSGARMVQLCAPVEVAARAPVEVVCSTPPLSGAVDRFRAVAVGPGLGRDAGAVDRLSDVLRLPLPVVVDADALHLYDRPAVVQARATRTAPTVLTPHDGELAALIGAGPSADRIATARSAARALGATVLLKGGPTVVAGPDGGAALIAGGSPRLATAGSGDVLTGMIAGRLAAFGSDRVDHRVCEAAHLHGLSAAAVAAVRPTAGDLLASLPSVVF